MTAAHVDKDDNEILAAMAAHMQRSLDRFRLFGRTGPKWSIAADSPAADERAALQRQYGPGGDWAGDAADYAADAGLLLVLAQADYLAVLQQIYRTHVGLIFGAGPTARSLLEINGYVFWLLHPDVPHIRTRAARVHLSQRNDVMRERSAAKQLDAPPEMLTRLGDESHRLKREVPRRFWPSEIAFDKHGNLHLRGERHPGPGEALRYLSVADEDEWNSQGAYALLSNASHPTLHMIVDTVQLNADGQPSHFGYADATYHYRLGRLALAGFLATWQINAAYRGLDQSEPRRLKVEIDNLPTPP